MGLQPAERDVAADKSLIRAVLCKHVRRRSKAYYYDRVVLCKVQWLQVGSLVQLIVLLL